MHKVIEQVWQTGKWPADWYADDIVLIASSEEELQELVSRVHGAAMDTGMRINVRKTEVMKVCENAPPMSITVNGENISEVSSLKYLGARFNAEALCEEDSLWHVNEWGSWTRYGGVGL